MSQLLLSFIIATLLLAGCLSPVAAPNALAPVNVCYVKGASSQVAGLYAEQLAGKDAVFKCKIHEFFYRITAIK